MSLLSADLDGVVGDLEQVDPLGAAPAAVGRDQDADLGVDNSACQRIGAEKLPRLISFGL